MFKKKIIISILIIFSILTYTKINALELNDDLKIEGNKVITYKFSNLYKDNNKIEQNLKLNLKGNINENIITDLKIDDLLPEKIEKMYFEYNNNKTNIIIGDLQFSQFSQFSLNEKKTRGLITNIKNIDTNNKNDLTLILTFENGKQVKDTFYGQGTFGPFKLSYDKIITLSERVYIDSNLKNRNLDYGIDYENGIISFNEEIPLGSEIVILYSINSTFDEINRYSFGALTKTKFNEKNNTQVGFIRSEENINFNENYYQLELKNVTELNLSHELALNKNITTNFTYAKSFLDKQLNDASNELGDAFYLTTNFNNQLFNAKLNLSTISPLYTPYHRGYVKAGKKNELIFDFKPYKKLIAKLGYSVEDTTNLNNVNSKTYLNDEEKFFSSFLYNFNEKLSMNTNLQTGNENKIYNVKFNGKLAMINFENDISNQKNISNNDQLNNFSIKAFTIPINKNTYFIEYIDNKRKSNILHDNNNDFNLKYKRKINSDLSLGYSYMNNNHTSINNNKTQLIENRIIADYNYSPNLTFTTHSAIKNENKTNAFEVNTLFNGMLFGVKYVPLNFLKLFLKYEIWNVDMLTKNINFLKTENSTKIILGWNDKPYSLELKNYMRSPEYDTETGILRSNKKSNDITLNYKLSSKIKFTSQYEQSFEKSMFYSKTSFIRQELKYYLNDDMNLNIKLEKEQTFISNTTSTFRFEAKL